MYAFSSEVDVGPIDVGCLFFSGTGVGQELHEIRAIARTPSPRCADRVDEFSELPALGECERLLVDLNPTNFFRGIVDACAGFDSDPDQRAQRIGGCCCSGVLNIRLQIVPTSSQFSSPSPFGQAWPPSQYRRSIRYRAFGQKEMVAAVYLPAAGCAPSEACAEFVEALRRLINFESEL